ncbi:Ribosome-binding ATPase YchF [Candidatus Bealeia paramacronuclearis]|uniref:Ribosome-binding ATPase YchF n=1 Tax=Candidatus Bealeia paramacronuclearis TaxID=1921001 RepID=A0ABZ2C9Y8_9PROT|nr:Ribosome-binding ATPase YchF [Candidatus Bealeia paramacronuclearis]
MGFQCGIVGLPNVGKSTLFNALTATQSAEAANYPFCTIEPNVGRVAVPDPRLETLAKIAKSEKIIPTQMAFVDIAGLVKGASQGEGLGNQFLGHIREVDAIIHVVRCFQDSDITHVEGTIDPLRDIAIIETELMLSDLESLEKRIPALEKKVRGKDEEATLELSLMKGALDLLNAGKPARLLEVKEDEKEAFKRLQLLTSKPVLYVCNVSEGEAVSGNDFTKKVEAYAETEGAHTVIISAAIEAEVSTLESEEDKIDFLKSLGLEETGLNRVIRSGHNLLHLITFFTVGPKEARAWTVHQGARAPEAAGVIHSDFERGFICAETIAFEDYAACQGEAGARAQGKLRQEGKNYTTKDGDVFHFRFNV